jgi:hypothetical protein
MDETQLTQNVDFLSIALEQMDCGNYDVAQDFVEEVYGDLAEELEE